MNSELSREDKSKYLALLKAVADSNTPEIQPKKALKNFMISILNKIVNKNQKNTVKFSISSYTIHC